MGKFKKVTPQVDFVKSEKEILDFWAKNNIEQKYVHKNENSKTKFSFIDGPITANNPMGIHHAEARTYKDLVQRYKNLKGYKQRFQNGFDCQGLWVEVEVEKALGFNSKKDIYDFGLGNFTNACKERVNKFAGIQTEQSKRLGMFMDWDNSYYTMSEENNLAIWHFLKVAFEKGLLYKDLSATTWCPRCETGLSQHEQADGYKDIEDQSVYVLFKLKERENEYILAWTTTPWTLSANVLLAVNPELEYVKTVKDGKTLYLAKAPAERLGFTDIEKVDVKDLLGLEYESLYDIPAQKDVEHKVVEWDLVTETDGTGVVHVAPGCGQEDFELGVKLGSAKLAPLTDSGVFIDGYGDLSGKFAHDVAPLVFEYLKEKELLYKTESYIHSYPHCWRCGTKCLFKLENNWFLNVRKLKDDMKAEVNKVNWLPEFAGKRMLDWLDNMGDWMISRKRFYGLSLPFYECKKCGKLTVVGSKEELKEKAVKPELIDKLPSLHRPWIDDIKIKCECGEEVERVTDVGDCWLDAGVVPFSTLKYLTDNDYWKEWYPGEFITEMIEQVRLWYYSMLVYGVVLGHGIPYKNVLNLIEVRNEEGNRMSKSKKTAIPFDEAADKAGTDSIRWLYSSQSLNQEYLRFGYNTLDEVRRKFLLPLWNSYVYIVTYATQYNWEIPERLEELKENKNNIMDKWILTLLEKTLNDVDENLSKYSVNSSARILEEFVNDLSTWFIRRSRDRFQSGDKDALNTLYYVLVQLVKVLTPFVPFITESIYQNLVVEAKLNSAKESVHLEDYPSYEKLDAKSEKLLSDMKFLRNAASLGLSVRVNEQLKVRQPLAEAVVALEGGVGLSEELTNVLAEELNVKSVKFMSKGLKAPQDSETLSTDAKWVSVEDGGVAVYLDVKLTDELKSEGLLREVVRKVQQLRKETGLQLGELVKLNLLVKDLSTKEMLSNKVEELKKSTSLSEVNYIDKVEGKVSNKSELWLDSGF